MSKKVKIIFASASLLLALVVGIVLVCVFNLKNEEPLPPAEEPTKVVGLIDNGTKDNLNLSFIADGDNFKNQTIQKVYEFKIENTSTNKIVLTTSSAYVLDNMAVSYYYSQTKLTDYQTLEGGDFSAQKIVAGSNCYLYLIVKVQDTTKNGSCTGETAFNKENVVYLTFKSDYFDDMVVELDETKKMSASQVPALPTGVLGRSYVGWYLDSLFENQADLTKSFNEDTTIYSKWEYVECDRLSYMLDSDSYKVVKGSSELPAHLIIPETYNDGTNGEKEITSIDYSSESTNMWQEGAFDNCFGNDDNFDSNGLISVSFPGTIKSLHWNTFYMVDGLEKVYISKGVTEISSGFAAYCPKLKYVYVEDVTTWTSSEIGEIDVELMQDPGQCAHIVKNYSLTYTDETDTIVKLNANGGVFSSIGSDSQYAQKVASTIVLDELENPEDSSLYIKDGEYWEFTFVSYGENAQGKISFSAKAGDRVVIDVISLGRVLYCFSKLNVEFSSSEPKSDEIYRVSRAEIEDETTQRIVYEITEDGDYFFGVVVRSIGSSIELIKFKAQVNSYVEDQSVVEMTKAEGQEIGQLETPTREGYKFIGWFTEAEGGELITESTPVNQPITYYAHWEKE